jgi:hypothetical protein
MRKTGFQVATLIVAAGIGLILILTLALWAYS